MMKSFPIFSAGAILVCVGVIALKAPLIAQVAGQPKSSAPEKKLSAEELRAQQEKEAADQQRRARDAQFATDLLRRSRATHRQLKSFRADMRQKTTIGSRSFSATGRYLQGEGNKMRLELDLKLDSGVLVTKGKLLQTCDGNVLKTLRTVGKNSRLTRRDIKQILGVAASRGQGVHGTLVTELGLGGIPAMLASLERSMIFESYQVEKSKGQKIYKLEGTWNPAFRKHLVGLSADRQSIPEFVPDRVRVYLDAGYILRAIEYLKHDAEGKTHQPMITMKFENFKRTSNIPDKEFTFETPKEVYPEDVTKECTVADVKSRLDAGDSFRLVDVREDREWSHGHIPTAIHLGKGVIERDIEATVPDTDTEIILYCGGGYRSALAADALQQMGYTKVISMDGGHHLERISLYSTQLATELRRVPKFRNQVTSAFLQTIGISSALHDIGKVGTADAILLKPGKLTDDERLRMQSHATVGGECLRQIEQRLANSNFLQMAREIALYHHERWDGTGYPTGLSGEEIPLAARIVSIADVYDALSVQRVYKKSIPHEKCVEMICAEAGKQFDPDLVEAFRRIESQFAAIASQFAERASEVDDADDDGETSAEHFMKISPETIEELQSGQASAIDEHERNASRSAAFAGRLNSKHMFFELAVVAITIALTCLMFQTVGFKMLVLNLFFLPVVLSGFFLGRYRAGVLALFAVVSASAVAVADLENFAAFTSPIAVILALSLWGAVLGLTALIVGTLSDENRSRMIELHEAHVGVIEVLVRYLQSSDPKLKAHSSRVAQLSQELALEMKLSPREIDDVRVAALLSDLGDVEVTTRVIHRAMGDLGFNPKDSEQYTFQGVDLVDSLGSVMTGALSLLHSQDDKTLADLEDEESTDNTNLPFGALILRIAREYDRMTTGDWNTPRMTSAEAFAELRRNEATGNGPEVIRALERLAARKMENATTTIPDRELQTPVPV
eukprot:g21881.t1